MQLEIARFTDGQCWQDMLDEVRSVVVRREQKHVAPELDLSPSELSGALAEKHRMEFKARHLPALVRMDGGEKVLARLAEHAGFELQRQRVMSPEEKLARLEDALSKLPNEIARGIREMAWGKR
jgi:hypothetical protein